MGKPNAKAEMLVRCPVAEVFDAFVRPETITRFWLESTSGPLCAGASVEWHFMVPGAVETVTVTAFDVPRHIAFDWSDGIKVDLQFTPLGETASQVAVVATGLGDEAVVDATEGFSIVLCDLKILLESGRSGNLVRDKAELIAKA